jgi:hypothetical protein
MGDEITIRMSETAPVRIDTRVWPIIAEADAWDRGKGTLETASEYEVIRVREHSDGRRLVYGKSVSPARDNVNAGFLVEVADDGTVLAWQQVEKETVRAIRRVAGILKRESLAVECISALPARVLR